MKKTVAGRQGRIWATEDIELLGSNSDRNIGARLGLPAEVILRERRKRGIAACQDVKGRAVEIPPELQAQLGIMSDTEIAKRLGVSQPTISRHRRNLNIKCKVEFGSLPDEAIPMLGKEMDSAVAKRFGVTRSCVTRRRNLLGIPALDRTPANGLNFSDTDQQSRFSDL